jgi:hypothetical protein
VKIRVLEKFKISRIAPIAVASPDLEKLGFFAVVFVYREYNG